jgi:uncharacterized protein (TIGR02145 family)
MKKIFFLFAMLVSVATSAQNHINIEMLGATYTTPAAVKFRVSWSSVPTVTGETHNAKVWVWIDFLKLNANNTTTGNTWTRATISAASPTASVAYDGSNRNGFWLQGNTGSYSATVTATLSNIPANAKFNWCAYVSDCPPNFTYVDNVFILKGTPPFTIKAANGSIQTISKKTLPVPDLTLIPNTMTDATGCPGIVKYTGCNLNNLNLGIVSFTSASTYKIGTQIWSSPVQATNCQKATYNGGSTGNYAADCRNNPGYSGHLFSICAVIRYAEQLCPEEWRVPTRSEYSALWTAMGAPVCNNNVETCNQPTALNNLKTQWALELNGVVLYNGTISNLDKTSYYISSSVADGIDGGWNGGIFGNTNWYYNPWVAGGHDESGATLRCIK